MKRGLIIIVVCAGSARAGGFYVPEVGSRATGLGGAVVADGADPSAVFHNPASLVDAEGLQVEVATTLVLPRITFFRRPLTDPNTGANVSFEGVDNTNTVIAAPYVGASYRIGERVTAGFAIYVPFGATLDFPREGSQRQIVTSIALRTIYASPAIAVTLPRGFSFGVAGNAIYGDLVLEQQNAIPHLTGDPEQYPDPDAAIEGSTRLTGRDPFSLGVTAGVGWQSADRRIQIGTSVMSPVTLRFEGDAHIENSGISALVDQNSNELQPQGVRDDQVRISLPLPLIARLGVAWRPTRRWRLEADVNWQRWSTFEKLVVDFVNEYELVPTTGAYLYDVTVENKWRNTWSARLGVEATPFAMPLALRLGVFFDQSPIDDRHFSVLTPDSDKLGLSGGARWSRAIGRGRLELDLAATHVILGERDVAPGIGGQSGSDGTILNKPAPSFFHGVTRAGFDLFTLAVAWRQ